MNAILLAAGYGTRLGDLVKKTPKCLIKIDKKPLLQIWLEKLCKAGVNKVLINTHFLSDQVIDFINSYNSINLKIEYTYEENLLGTGGTLIKNINFSQNEDCLLIHADNLVFENIGNFIKHHNNRRNCTSMSLMSFITSEPKECGIIKINKKNVLTSFYEKSDYDNGNIANGAVYILSKEMIKELSTMEFNTQLDFSNDVIPKYINKINVFKTNKPFFDIGTIKNLEKARLTLKQFKNSFD